MYDSNMVKPMREELTQAGVEELKTSGEVEAHFQNTTGTSLVFVNSVCGCAAGSARPGLIHSLQNDIKPNRIATVFAGVDKEATDKARGYFVGYPPSSPSIAIFREGQLVYMVERHDIEGTPAEALGSLLKSLYDKYCGDTVNEAIEIKDPKAELEISVQEVKDMLDKGEPFAFLDVRDEVERGASLPPWHHLAHSRLCRRHDSEMGQK